MYKIHKEVIKNIDKSASYENELMQVIEDVQLIPQCIIEAVSKLVPKSLGIDTIHHICHLS